MLLLLLLPLLPLLLLLPLLMFGLAWSFAAALQKLLLLRMVLITLQKPLLHDGVDEVILASASNSKQQHSPARASSSCSCQLLMLVPVTCASEIQTEVYFFETINRF